MTGHSLAGQTIHIDDKGIVDQVDSNYTFQEILDSQTETISYYGAKSERYSLTFILFEEENSNNGNASLKAATKTNADVNLTTDLGSMGNVRILSYKATRLMATNHAEAVYSCTAEVVSTS